MDVHVCDVGFVFGKDFGEAEHHAGAIESGGQDGVRVHAWIMIRAR